MLFLNVYRPPSSNAETDPSLATCIENVVAQNKECFVLGDFNINTLYVTSPSNRLLKSIHSLGLSQMVDKPTIVDVNNSTKGPVTNTSLIDVIYVSHVHNIVKAHVSNVTLSHHYPVFVIRRCNAGLNDLEIRGDIWLWIKNSQIEGNSSELTDVTPIYTI